MPQEAVRFVEDLERLQAAAGEPFPVPQNWTIEDLREVRRAVRLLDGHRVAHGSGSVTIDAISPEPILQAFERNPTSLRLTTNEPYVAHVAGHDLDLGPYTVYIPSAQLGPASTADGGHQFTVLPEPGSGIEIALGGLPIDADPPTT